MCTDSGMAAPVPWNEPKSITAGGTLLYCLGDLIFLGGIGLISLCLLWSFCLCRLYVASAHSRAKQIMIHNNHCMKNENCDLCRLRYGGSVILAN